MEVTAGTVGDTTQPRTLLHTLDDIESVSGDTGYLSHNNCMLVEAKGAIPYLKPRRHHSEKIIGPPAWKHMIRSYRLNKRRWMKHYHTRPMAETAFSAIKRTLGHSLTSIRRDLQKLELIIKVIVYNITVLIKSRQRGI